MTAEESSPGHFYLTTAINYTNGPAHMGHAYEAATSDALARFARLDGKVPTYFVTGSDEHGQKIAQTAAALDQEPLEICDKVGIVMLLSVTKKHTKQTTTNIPPLFYVRTTTVCNWLSMPESTHSHIQRRLHSNYIGPPQTNCPSPLEPVCRRHLPRHVFGVVQCSGGNVRHGFGRGTIGL